MSPMSLVALNKFHDCASYFLLNTMNISTPIYLPTWNAFNTLVHEAKPLTTFLLTTADARKPKIRMSNSPEWKTIVTLDLQLYSKCIQLQSRQDISPNFVIRMGELHVVFAFLKATGKHINNSGLDTAFTEAGIYGPTLSNR